MSLWLWSLIQTLRSSYVRKHSGQYKIKCRRTIQDTVFRTRLFSVHIASDQILKTVTKQASSYKAARLRLWEHIISRSCRPCYGAGRRLFPQRADASPHRQASTGWRGERGGSRSVGRRRRRQRGGGRSQAAAAAAAAAIVVSQQVRRHATLVSHTRHFNSMTSTPTPHTETPTQQHCSSTSVACRNQFGTTTVWANVGPKHTGA